MNSFSFSLKQANASLFGFAGIAAICLGVGLWSAFAANVQAQAKPLTPEVVAMGKAPAPNPAQPPAAPPVATTTPTATVVVPPAAATVPAAPEGSPEFIKQAVEKWLNGRYKVDGVTKTPMAGIYEVRFGTDLIYVDEKANFAFAEGQLIDIKKGVNITEARVDELLRVKFDDLPLNLALKQVQGTGKRKLVVFEDPNCPHCRNTRMAINQLKDTTVYTYTYPILRADSAVKVNKALCAKDQLKAWNDLMLAGQVPDNAGTCKNNLNEIIELGRKLRVTGTPTLIFADGKRVPSGTTLEGLQKLMDQHSKG
jgi:thiol:disulfide interchange protein DsbC